MDILRIQQRVLPFSLSIPNVVFPVLTSLFVIAELFIWSLRPLVGLIVILFSFRGLRLEKVSLVLFDQVWQLGCYKSAECQALGVFSQPARVVQFVKNAEDFFYFVGCTVIRTDQNSFAFDLFVGVVAWVKAYVCWFLFEFTQIYEQLLNFCLFNLPVQETT